MKSGNVNEDFFNTFNGFGVKEIDPEDLIQESKEPELKNVTEFELYHEGRIMSGDLFD